MSFKRAAIAATAALLVAGGAVGVVAAQQAPTATPSPRVRTNAPPRQAAPHAQPRRDQFLGALAGKLGITADQLRQAIADTRTELGIPDRGPGPRGHGGPPGPGGPGGFGRPSGPGFGHFGGVHLDVVAQALGITADQLRQELRQELHGKSLADLARARNVDPARVATALKNEASTRIDQAVTAGRLTAEQAIQAKQRAGQEIDRLMTVQLPAPGMMPGRPGARGPRGQGGAPGAPGAPRTPAATATPGTRA